MKLLGFDFECLGQGFGSYWAWVTYKRFFGWQIKIERFYGYDGELVPR